MGFEIFILSASIHVLLHGARSVSGRAEAAAHSLCVLGGLAAFAAFYYESYRIDKGGYNAATQTEVQVCADQYQVHTDTDINPCGACRPTHSIISGLATT